MHSPHSPLLADIITYKHLKETQLSARYINNASFLYNQKKSDTYDFIKSDRESFPSIQTFGRRALSSKLLCYCETTEAKSSERICNNVLAESEITQRLVPTRNAATSPHLDVRKLGSMTTLLPSSSLTKEMISKSNNSKNNKFKIFNSSDATFGDEKSPNKAAVGPNSIKIFRTARSLSPRPPLKYQRAIVLPDSNQLKAELFSLPKTYNWGNTKQYKKLCRSEQSSPNVVEETKMRFSYNESSYHSISSLGSSFADPWLRNSSDSKLDKSSLTVKEAIEKISVPDDLKNKKDPWIKMTDVERNLKMSKYNLFRETKSFSGSKFDFESITTDLCVKNKSQIANDLNKETKINVSKEPENQLQSAPVSPRFLTAANINSPSVINKTETAGNVREKTTARSCSFSPARIKDSNNPFADRCILFANSTPPLISLDSEIKTNQTDMKTVETPVDYDFLTTYPPKILNTRHSFSSVPDKKGEELQLDIRRLSDQLRQNDSVLTNNISIFSSDCNIREKIVHKINSSNDISDRKRPVEIPTNSADFSDYLEQFRCNEARKVSLQKEKAYLEYDKTLNNKSIAINKSQKSSDCLLETTC